MERVGLTVSVDDEVDHVEELHYPLSHPGAMKVEDDTTVRYIPVSELSIDPLDRTSADKWGRSQCASPDSVALLLSEQDLYPDLPEPVSSEETESSPSHSDSEEFQDAETGLKRRRVKFADESGLPLSQIRELEPDVIRRVILLLLSPDDKVFEFLHVEYSLDPFTTVQVLLEQIQTLASHPIFKGRKFSCLSKMVPDPTMNNEQELPHQYSLQDCHLGESEIILGVLDGFTTEEVGALATPLLASNKIIKAVTHAKRSGRGLKTAKSGAEWKVQAESKRDTSSREDNVLRPLVSQQPPSSTETNNPLSDMDSKANSQESSVLPMEGNARDDENRQHRCTIIEGQENGPTEMGDDRVLSQAPMDVAAVTEIVINSQDEGVRSQVHDQNVAHDKSVLEGEPVETEVLDDGCSSVEEDDDTDDAVIEWEWGDADIDPAEPWEYPQRVREFLGGDEGAERTVLWINVATLGAVCYHCAAFLG